MRLKGISSRLVILAGASAFLGAAAQPNEVFLYGNWLAGFAFLVPLYHALRIAETPGQAAYAGAIFGMLHHALTSYWLFFYKNFAFWTLGTTTLAYGAVYAAAIMYLWYALRAAGKASPLTFAFGWAALEYAKSSGFLAYPWGLAPYAFSAVPLMLQTADIWGVYGISFCMALTAATAGELLQGPRLPDSPGLRSIHAFTSASSTASWLEKQMLRRRTGIWLGIAASTILAMILYGFFALAEPRAIRTDLRLILCQQNTDPWISGEQAALESNVNLAARELERLRTSLEDPADLVVFSETSLRRPFAEYRSWFDAHPRDLSLLGLLRTYQIPLFTGLPIIWDWNTFEASNAVALISADGSVLESYAKMHPVPFAEAIPFWEFAWFRNFLQKVIGIESGWVMGTRPVIFSLAKSPSRGGDTVRFAAPICFEDAFAPMNRAFYWNGAELLINLTNDSWSLTQSAQIQHWAVARIRAIELRRTLVRSTNSGLTCVIDATGRNIAELPMFEAAVMTVRAPVYEDPPTFYAIHGDWFAHCSLFWMFCIIVYGILHEHAASARRKHYTR